MSENNTIYREPPLSNLILILEDAESLYLDAAEHIDGTVISLLFRNFGFQKNRYRLQLKNVMREWGWTSSTSDNTDFNHVHTWMDLKRSLRFGRQRILMQACIRGEEKTLTNYQLVIKEIEDYPEVKQILLQQINGIKTVVDTMKAYSSFGSLAIKNNWTRL